MATPLHVLILEDRSEDAELLAYELKRAGFTARWERVDTEVTYRAHLESPPDVILADYSLPQFDAMRALEILQEQGLDVPFIVVSGRISEEVAVESLHRGAADYLLKDRLVRLGPAIQRALALKELRDQKRRAEDSLRISEDRYRTISELTSDFAYSLRVEPDGSFVTEWITEAAFRITGYSIDDVGEPDAWQQFIHPDDRAVAMEQRQRILSGEVISYEVRVIARGGEERVLRVNARPVWSEQGDRVVRIYGAAEDITERKRAEQERAQLIREQVARAQAEASQRRFAFLSEASKLVAGSLDHRVVLTNIARLAVPELADWCIVDVVEGSGTAERVAVVCADSGQQGLAQEIRHVPPIGRDQSDWASTVLRTGQSVLTPRVTDTELQSIARSEQHLAMLRQVGPRSYMTVALQGRGATLGALILATAESGRQYTADDLALAEELARRAALAIENARLYQETERARRRQTFLAEASAILASSLDYEETIKAVTDLAVPQFADWCLVHLLYEDGTPEQVTVAHPDPMLRERVRELYRGHFPSYTDPHPMARVLRTREPTLQAVLTEEDWRRIANDEKHLELLQTFRPRSAIIAPLVARGHVLGAISFVYSESNHRYTEEDFGLARELARRAASAVDNARLYQQAQNALQAREEFLSIASHELKTPLTTLKGCVQILDRYLGRPELDRSRLDSIVRQLQQQSDRLEALIGDLLDVSRIRRGRLELRPEHIDLVAVAREVLARFDHAGERKEHHQVALDASGPVAGYWDPARIDQILTNLVSNALKYSPDGGEVRVTIARCDDEVELIVRDHGIGISAEEQTRLFRPFMRAESSRQQVGGTGLGLYITSQIVERHGGTISVESSPGEGSAFTVRLPIMPPQKSDTGPLYAEEVVRMDSWE